MKARVVSLVILALTFFCFFSNSALADLDTGYSCSVGFEPAYGMLVNIQGPNSCYKCSNGQYDPFSGVCAIGCEFDSDTGFLECQGTSQPEIVPAILDSDRPYCVTGSEYPENPFDIACYNMETELECHPGPNLFYDPFDIICDPVDPGDDDDDDDGGGEDSGGPAVCEDESGGVIDCSEPDCDICQVLEDCALGIERLRISLTRQLDEIIRKLDEIAALLANGLGGGEVNVEKVCNPLPPDYGGGSLPVTGDVPWCESRQIIECPVLFDTDVNFVYHLIDTFKEKFPIDVVIGTSWPTPIEDSEATLDFFGEFFEIDFFFDALDILKLPSVLSFLVWCLVSL